MMKKHITIYGPLSLSLRALRFLQGVAIPRIILFRRLPRPAKNAGLAMTAARGCGQLKKYFFLILFLFFSNTWAVTFVIKPGAEQLNDYLPLLKDKRVGVFANHSSRIGKESLVDVLLRKKIHVVKIFAPEHGFRGEVDARISDGVDSKTHLPIISLYGKKLTPTADDLRDIDILLFDIQDVGVRFYTYISSLQKFMEAAVNNNKPLIILDRPNPNGFYVDGPVLDRRYQSFTGMQPIPIVYGMTIGEYAKMLVGEEWLHVIPKEKAKNLRLTVIPCLHYTHKSLYVPPVKPSPNLPNIQSIYLYPSIGLLEGTAMSVGRGTTTPFQLYGHPLLSHKLYQFIPRSQLAAASPLFKNKICYGFTLSGDSQSVLKRLKGKLQIQYLMKAYQLFPNKQRFFAGFNYVSGNSELVQQVQSGVSEEQIRLSWEPQLIEFKKIRKKYLLYPDFE